MKIITVSVDDEIYRRARVRAAELDTSVSAVVKKLLADFARSESEHERLKREERSLRERVAGFSAGDRVSREDAHDRRGS